MMSLFLTILTVQLSFCCVPSAADVVGHPEFDIDDSDRSSVYSTPSPQTRQFQTLAASSVAMTTASAAGALYRQPVYHPSLRKKKWFDRQSSVSAMTSVRQNTLEKSWSSQPDRPMSLMAPYSTESSVIANKVADMLLQQVGVAGSLVRCSILIVVKQRAVVSQCVSVVRVAKSNWQ